MSKTKFNSNTFTGQKISQSEKFKPDIFGNFYRYFWYFFRNFSGIYKCIYMGDFANYWQAFVPHLLWFSYHFMSVYYHLKEHYVNFFRFFKASLTTLYTHRIIEFSKTLNSNHFLLGLWNSKKKYQDVTLCKKVSAFWTKKYYFSDRNARKYSKSKIDFKNVFLRVFRHFNSQFYIFFLKNRLFYIWHVIFRLGFARVHNDFFF